MPLAGAGSTSGAVLGSSRGGKGICGPRGCLCEGVRVRMGAGETPPPPPGLGAIADVERRLGVRRGSIDGAFGILAEDGESEFSGLGAWRMLPLLCAEGGFEDNFDAVIDESF